MTEQAKDIEMVEREKELKERKREYNRQYRLKKHGEPVVKTPLTTEEITAKAELKREYQRHYRMNNIEKSKLPISHGKIKMLIRSKKNGKITSQNMQQFNVHTISK